MKKTVIAILGLSLVLAIFGLVSIMGIGSKSNALAIIGADKAKEIAFTDSGYSVGDAREISTEYDRENGRDIYKVEFEINNLDFDYYIDAYTGAIIERKIPTESAQAQATDFFGTQKSSNDTKQNDEQSQPPAQIPAQNTQQPPQTQTQNTQQTDSRHTERIHHTQEAQQSTTPSQNSRTSSLGIISETDAKKLVLARVPGASDTNFKKFNLDFDDGRYEYEGKLVYNNIEYEFEIDAYSGNFRDWDAESIYD